MFKSISKITVYVDNQDAAVKFWTDKCGFELKADNPMGTGMRWIEVGPKNSDVTFVIYSKQAMKVQNPSTSVEHPSIILTADNINVIHQKLKDNGVVVYDITSMPNVDMFQFEDNENNRYIVSVMK